ncbi:MAG TPA: ribosomal protein S18-alanine N-acetyltransferase [Terriglobales bacterium]|nr:ribosomal protein S18-alanine N-acetyltransferase [Terriglobales bacterium]
MSQSPEANSDRLQNSTIFVRTATADDLDAILKLEQSAPQAAHWRADHYESRIHDQPNAACFLVSVSRASTSRLGLCGFLCARIVAGEWEIENVVVDRDLRRQGIGSRLMQALILRWEESHGTALLLEVRESNDAARSLYERQGFREVGRRRAYYGDPSEDAILYALRR